MLSPADMLIIGAVALIAFGPDQLPKVARRAGQVMRDVQNTSQSFIREMERAADEAEHDKTETAPAGDFYNGTYAEPSPAPGIHVPAEPAPPAQTQSEPGRAGFAHEDASGI